MLEFKISNTLATGKAIYLAGALAPVTYGHAPKSQTDKFGLNWRVPTSLVLNWRVPVIQLNRVNPRQGTQGNIIISPEHIYELGSKIDVRFLGA